MIGFAKGIRRPRAFHFSDAAAGRLVPFDRPPLLSNIGRFRRAVRCVDKIFISRFAARARTSPTKSVSKVVLSRITQLLSCRRTYLSVKQSLIYQLRLFVELIGASIESRFFIGIVDNTKNADDLNNIQKHLLIT